MGSTHATPTALREARRGIGTNCVCSTRLDAPRWMLAHQERGGGVVFSRASGDFRHLVSPPEEDCRQC